MKRHSFTTRLLVPVMIMLMLFPPLSCLIFSQTAKRNAQETARADLEILQRNLSPLISDSFDGESESQRQDSEFLSQIGPIMANKSGSARLMILGTRMQVIYPRDEKLRETVSPLANALSERLSASEELDTLTFDGEAYFLKVYKTPESIARIRYVIAYCAASDVEAWVKGASGLVLVISAVFAGAAFLIIWLNIRKIANSVKRLCRESERIGGGSFEEIEPSFELEELEELRLAMNGMSRKLKRSNDAQKNFFQNVSHELRNPLMSISGYAQGIERGVFSPPTDAAHTIMEESARLTELVSGLLGLSRLELDENVPEFGAVSVFDTVSDSLDRMNGLAVKSGVSLRLSPFERVLCVFGNEELLETVLNNLLSNAVRYAESTVVISAAHTEDTVSISVSDDGAGISPTEMPRIFERGYKGEGGHFGIGLTVARSAARKMHGTLTAENAASGGAIFTLTLERRNEGRTKNS